MLSGKHMGLFASVKLCALMAPLGTLGTGVHQMLYLTWYIFNVHRTVVCVCLCLPLCVCWLAAQESSHPLSQAESATPNPPPTTHTRTHIKTHYNTYERHKISFYHSLLKSVLYRMLTLCQSQQSLQEPVKCQSKKTKQNKKQDTAIFLLLNKTGKLCLMQRQCLLCSAQTL